MNEMIDGMSKYHILVQLHDYHYAPFAHRGASFLPWHREYVWRVENALREHNLNVFMPYWDYTLEERLPTKSGVCLKHYLVSSTKSVKL